jgi:DNA replication and repair protein RecF
MHIKQVTLTNFRNYSNCQVDLVAGRNILVGQNAQGKSNFLEAIEMLATARSSRADHDLELVRWGADRLYAEVLFEAHGSQQSLSLVLGKPAGAKRMEKTFKVNGLSQSSVREMLGRLLIVSFQSHDLNLLRGGPKFRRDWLDSIILKIRPTFHETFSNYQKIVSQRNKLLKTLSEKGRLSASDQDELLVWDKQLCRFAARIIKQRLQVLAELLPIAEEHQSRLSRTQEKLTLRYLFRVEEKSASFEEAEESTEQADAEESTGALTAAQLASMEELDVAKTIFRLLRDRRHEELRRRQSLIGPHRDDIVFCLNDADAISFASQGQQRSIVLSLKLAELSRLQEVLCEVPVLLLDDVLAELDEFRQGLLMSAVSEDMQTIITTTHVTGFDAHWLEGAQLLTVAAGEIQPSLALSP